MPAILTAIKCGMIADRFSAPDYKKFICRRIFSEEPACLTKNKNQAILATSRKPRKRFNGWMHFGLHTVRSQMPQ